MPTATKKKPAPKAKPKAKAKAKPPAEAPRKPTPVKDSPHTSGEAKEERLALVQPNDWNPNQMPPHKYEAAKQSMRQDGWLKSHALLIWRTDEKGRKKMIIIDGEHRWKAGNELGFVKGPMVFLDGITKAKAMELTIKLDNNRGDFEAKGLAAVLRELVPTLHVEDPAALLGFNQAELNKMLALPPIDLDGVDGEPRAPTNPGIGSVTSENAVTKMVPLYMDVKDYEEFMQQVKAIGDVAQLENVTDVVRHAVAQCHSALKKK